MHVRKYINKITSELTHYANKIPHTIPIINVCCTAVHTYMYVWIEKKSGMVFGEHMVTGDRKANMETIGEKKTTSESNFFFNTETRFM